LKKDIYEIDIKLDEDVRDWINSSDAFHQCVKIREYIEYLESELKLYKSIVKKLAEKD
jgi:hypothetical protein